MVRVPTPSDLNETEETFPRQASDHDPPIVGYKRRRADPFPWIVRGIGFALVLWIVFLVSIFWR